MKRPKNTVDVSNGEASTATAGTETEEQRRQRRKELKTAKRERKQVRKQKDKERKERQKVKKQVAKEENPGGKRKGREVKLKAELPENADEDSEDDGASDAEEVDARGMAGLTTDLTTETNDDQDRTESSDEEIPAIFSPRLESGASSTSSIQPSIPLDTEPQKIQTIPPPEIKPQKTQTSQIPESLTNNPPQSTVDTSKTPRERFDERMLQLRLDRKADGLDGRPARNRQELLNQRRQKELERRKAKKEQWQKEKDEEQRKEDEEIAKRFSPGGSGSLLASPRSPIVGDASHSNSFTFGRVAFADGQQADASLNSIRDPHKRKGPMDPASALKAVQGKAGRLAGLDDDKRRRIEQQDMWLNARRKAHGEKVRDDESLLKRALKRKETDKKKSGAEWTRREEGVKGGMEARQRKREDNLQKRRDEKFDKKVGNKKGGKVKKNRPGFEGSFTGRTGGKKNQKKN